MKTFEQIRYLQEGLYDPNIFKAFFLAGGPGSGKTFVTRSAFAGFGLRMINSDNAFEMALKKNNLSLKMPEDEAEARDIVRARAKGMTGTMLDLSIKGRLGLIIDGTGRDYDKLETEMRALQQLGYESHMIFVNTSLDVALQRNQERDRTLPEKIVVKSWKDVQSNIGKFSNLFRGRFIIIDNNDKDEDILTAVYKRVKQLANKKVTNGIAKNWIAKELEMKRRV